LAYDKGIVLIAAAGNAGPKSPPLFPGAFDPYVIAVTATDADDKLFTGANRGKYISVAAPGVDILVPAPEVPDNHRNVGRGCRGERHRGAVAGTQSETEAGRHSPHSDRERKAARERRARRQFRLRTDRSAAGAAVGRSENRDHHAAAPAVGRTSTPISGNANCLCQQGFSSHLTRCFWNQQQPSHAINTDEVFGTHSVVAPGSSDVPTYEWRPKSLAPRYRRGPNDH
jgi:subtilisin family serine protease